MLTQIRQTLTASFKQVLSIITRNYLVEFPLWLLKRVGKLLTCGELAMYLIGGIAICGGLGIILAWMSNGFCFENKNVLNAMIVFAPSIIGTSLFDLIFALCRQDSRLPPFKAAGLIVLALLLLLFVATAYLKEVSGEKSPCLTYWAWGLSLVYWIVVNADDIKFNGDLGVQNTQGGDPMRPMGGMDTIPGVES